MTTRIKKPRFALRQSPKNRNSWPSVANALIQAGILDAFELVVAPDSRPVPAHTAVVAYSFPTPLLDTIREEIVQWTQRRDRPRLIAGGAHPTADPEGTLALGFDCVCVGEAERCAHSLVGWLTAEDPQPGAVLRSQGPAWDLDSSLHVEPHLGLYPFVEIARGCGHACAFCQSHRLFGSRVRTRSPEVVARGLEVAVRAGYHRFRFLSPDAFNYGGKTGTERLQALETLLDASFRAGASQLMLGSFPSEVRPESVEPELAELVFNRCLNRQLVIGVQAGSDDLLRLMNRGHTIAQAERAVRLTIEAGLTPIVDVIFGFPGEQVADQLATLNLVTRFLDLPRVHIHIHGYIPLPDTRSWPGPPAKLDRRIRASLDELAGSQRVFGNWREQQRLARDILHWREQGLIRV